jgi:futalosine hydrolase
VNREARVLAVVAVDAEARAIGTPAGWTVRVGGVGRTNAAAATVESLLRDGPFDAVLSIGVAGALPGGTGAIGDLLIARESVYMEEGIETPEGFRDIRGIGFPLGAFEGNRVPADATLLSRLSGLAPTAAIATVATCSGTDRLAGLVAARTGAAAEAMEGAAVLHAAGRLGVPAIEVRAISNTTGDRPRQRWDLPAAFAALAAAAPRIAQALARA